MAKPIYIGYSTVANTGLDTILADIELVKQDLLNHFNTRLGERPMRPSFGSIIHDLLFDVFDDRTEELVLQDAQRVFASDPRVELVEMGINVDPESHEINLEAILFYTEFNMNDVFNATFTERN